MKELKRMSYKKLFKELESRKYDCYRISKEELTVEGATSGLLGVSKKDTYQLVLRKYKNNNTYVVELDTDNEELIEITKDYFNNYNNIDYIMVNGN